MALKVAIVGGGFSGIATAKQCLAEGFSVTVFEARDNIGGQWYYEDPDPVTGEAHSSLSLQYINEYANHFGVKQHVRLHTKVVSCNELEGNQWEVAYVTNGGERKEEIYDALFVCSGKNTKPHIPAFKGMESFQGEIFHSHVYRRPEGFKGKRVAIIGFGSSAVDIASEICEQGEQCYLITRRGGWVCPRYVFGKPVQAWDSRFSQVFPTSISQWVQTKLIEHVGGKLPPELQPEHAILEANPVIRSGFIENINAGRIKPLRAGIEEVTATGLTLTSGETLGVDAIILCTGYDIEYPVIPEDCYRSKHSEFIDSPNSVHLYRLTVPPRHPTLFIMGVFELPGPIQPAVELQARWTTAVLTGRIVLPSPEQMSKSIASSEKRRAKQWVKSDRHAVSVHFLPYCDSLADDLGVAPTFGRLFSRIFTSNPFRALSILNGVYFGIFSSAQYRLFGTGSNPEIAAATFLRLFRGGKELSEDENIALRASSSQNSEMVAEAKPKATTP
ncbi:hypothetical protein DTO164E3_6321 [Paecilomyces variotii]|nr:hypothetical protein DTO164E3_6321 [Paecilomyces variotii]KAJ9288870.1 hypothetical protein DTO021C3_3670 [Paecilomyces variotii]KAJ9407839.1 hypothetical protein DTO045G8_4306 [Paecilomyces variotii]